jgi:hypothetical protein
VGEKLHISDWKEIGTGEIRERIGGEIPERECRIGGLFVVIFESKLYPNNYVNLKTNNWERNANFAKEMTTLKERLKEKVNWSQVDLVMVGL